MNGKTGDIGFSLNVESWAAKLVRFFTGGPWSHCFVFFADIYNERTVIESDVEVQIIPFSQYLDPQTKDVCEIWRPIKATSSDIKTANKYLLQYHSGVTYGVMQRVWFIWKVLLGKFKIKAKKNFWPQGVICSELLFVYMRELGGEYLESVSHLTENEVDPMELYLVVINRPDLWEFVDKNAYPQTPAKYYNLTYRQGA